MKVLAMVGLAGLCLLFAVAASAPTEAHVDAAQLPCNMVCDRTVEPHDIMVNEKVHVHVSCHADCQQTRQPIDVFFVVDRTVTMAEKHYLDPTKDALIGFVNKMDFNTSAAGLITYAANDQVVTNLTRDRTRLLAGINAIKVSEETDVRGLQGAFRTATQKLDNDGTPGNERVVMLFAAGQDVQEANINMPTVTQAARNAGVKVAFLMFPDARYAHYVDASSDCTSPSCPRWQAPNGQVQQKMAWGVDASNVVTVLTNTVFDLLTTSGDTITQVRMREVMHSCAEFDVASSVPPPGSPSAPPYVAMDWIYAGANPLTIAIDYDARLVCGDDTYPATSQTRAIIDMASGQQIEHDLPNPLITVHNPRTPTATESATAAPPTVTPTSSPTPSASATVPAPTDTSTPEDEEGGIYLPGILRGGTF